MSKFRHGTAAENSKGKSAVEASVCRRVSRPKKVKTKGCTKMTVAPVIMSPVIKCVTVVCTGNNQGQTT